MPHASSDSCEHAAEAVPSKRENTRRADYIDVNVKKAEIPAYQAIGQSLSSFLLSAVNPTSQTDVSDILRNLGSRPAPISAPSRSSTDFSSSSSTLDFVLDHTSTKARAKRPPRFDGCTYSLRDFFALDALETLLLQYGKSSHMGVRDPSYLFFVNSGRNGALYYKVLDRVAVVTGDPLSASTQYFELLDEFRTFCKTRIWGVAMMAASDNMAALARGKGWTSMRFSVEKVLNPMNNPLIAGTGGKRTVTKCKQLLKSGMTVQIYCPTYQNDKHIESELLRIYDDWRTDRNASRIGAQAYMTVFDILALPRLMTFIYARDTEGRMQGFAALRKLENGFHLDPFISTADAPRGTTDLLLFSAMALCNMAGITKLCLGFEPLADLAESDISGMPDYMSKLTRKVHKRMWSNLPLDGKHAFYQRFYPDVEQDAGLHIIYFHTPGPRHMMAMIHFANISLRATQLR